MRDAGKGRRFTQSAAVIRLPSTLLHARRHIRLEPDAGRRAADSAAA